jgi:ornithine cyclodeaminase/alanine dehydrogenase
VVRVYAGPRRRPTGDDVEAAPDVPAAVAGADVVITAGPMAHDPQRHLDPAWLPQDCLVLPVDFDAYVRADLATSAGMLVVDDRDQFEHYRGLGHFAGWPTPDRSLGEALDRAPDARLRICCSLGVGAVDAAVAAEVYRRASEAGAGTRLSR